MCMCVCGGLYTWVQCWELSLGPLQVSAIKLFCHLSSPKWWYSYSVNSQEIRWYSNPESRHLFLCSVHNYIRRKDEKITTKGLFLVQHILSLPLPPPSLPHPLKLWGHLPQKKRRGLVILLSGKVLSIQAWPPEFEPWNHIGVKGENQFCICTMTSLTHKIIKKYIYKDFAFWMEGENNGFLHYSVRREAVTVLVVCMMGRNPRWRRLHKNSLCSRSESSV